MNPPMPSFRDAVVVMPSTGLAVLGQQITNAADRQTPRCRRRLLSVRVELPKRDSAELRSSDLMLRAWTGGELPDATMKQRNLGCSRMCFAVSMSLDLYKAMREWAGHSSSSTDWDEVQSKRRALAVFDFANERRKWRRRRGPMLSTPTYRPTVT